MSCSPSCPTLNLSGADAWLKPVPPAGRWSGGEAGSEKKVGVDSLCSEILKFGPLSLSLHPCLPLKSPDDVLVLSHSWVLRVEMGVTQESLVLAVDSLAGRRDMGSLRRTRLPS